jgi:RHS repeat-associated protein
VAVGHPVDVASGEQFTAAHDVEVPGVAPLIFRRLYNTRFLEREPSVLGPGWVHAFEASLTRDLDGFVFEGHDGDRVEFDDVGFNFDQQGSLYNTAASMELRREGERLAVYHWHDIDEPVQKYVFDLRDGERMLLVARELPSGQGIALQRDRLGRVATLTQNSERRRLYFSYDSAGRLESLRLGLAANGIEGAQIVARYRYDERSRLVAVADALGAEQRYGYDDAGRLTLEQGRRGGTYRMSYDAQGRCVETTGDGGYQQRRFIYEPGRTTRVIDSLGRETLYQYNDLGQVERRIDPNGATHVTAFDDAGRVAEEIDPVGATTSYEYDARGRLSSKVFPNGARLGYEYDEFHQPTKITEPDGAEWKLAYQRGALVSVTDPFARNVRYIRDEQNRLIGATTSAGQELRVRTNDTWTEEVIEDQLGVIVRRQLDLYLNALQSEDAVGPLGKAAHDALGRMVRSERPDGSMRQLEYDPEGLVTRLIDARGGHWRARYSPYGDCVEQIDPLGRRHQFAWDTEGRLTTITNPKGEQARFQYDLVGNLTTIQHFDGSSERASYDLARRLVSRTRPDGTQLQLARDIVGNLLKVTAGEKELRSFSYDLCGSPVEANSTDAQVLFEYATGGRLLAEVQQGRRIEYEYDSRGFLSKRSFEGSKAGPLHFEHDSRGRLRRFYTEPAPGDAPVPEYLQPQNPRGQTFDYDGRDRCDRRQLGPVTEERRYDLQGRLRHQHLAGIVTRRYEYDAEGALLELVDSLRGRREYKYDLAEQLIASTSVTLGDHVYTYDANSNLSGRDTQTLTYDSGNRLKTQGEIQFERDVNGQMTRQTSAERDDRYEWDALGQLVCVRHRDGAVTRFGYDALGRRVFKEHRCEEELPGPSVTAPITALEKRVQYWWSRDDLLAEQSSAQLTEYAMWGFVTDALWDDGQLRHLVYSQQGVPQELVDTVGNVVWRGTFDDWGRLISESGRTTCRLRMPGQLADPETDLYYNRFRYYSPNVGQFTSSDPIAFRGGLNVYRFAANALNWADPLGLSCGEDGCTAPKDEIVEVPLRDLRWSQTTAGGKGRADKLRASLAAKGWSGDPIDVVRTPDGLVTVDHTRPAVALELGMQSVPARVHGADEPLPSDMRSRPWNRSGQTADTWGEAVALRGAGQSPPIGPTGSPVPPRLPKPG